MKTDVVLGKVGGRVQGLVLEDFSGGLSAPKLKAGPSDAWKAVADIGSRLWLDTGDIDQASKLWNENFSALTTNNTLLNREIQKGIYDDLVKRAADSIREVAPEIDEKTLVLEISFVLNAYHGLKLVQQFGANVSLELHTDLAHDVERIVRYGKRFFNLLPEKFIIKVPLTPEGFIGCRKLNDAGVPVNFTLGYAARQNYLAALLARPKFVNVFLGRLNTFVADYQLGSGRNVGEKACLATQRALNNLRDSGRSQTSLIAASLRTGEQVAALMGVDVMTLPPKVAGEYQQSPVENTESRVFYDPDVPLADGVSLSDFDGDSLWTVSDDFKACVDALLVKDVDSLTGESVQSHFEAAGFGDFLPRWSEEELAIIRRDGKIPDYNEWKTKLSTGKIGLDALMNVSGLLSFTVDQEALDGRIGSLIF
jgi:transaldolase